MNVSAADICFWGLDSPHSHQAIALYNVLDSRPDAEQLRDRLLQTIEVFPKLKKRRCPKPSSAWEPASDIDLNYHLQFKTLDNAYLENIDTAFQKQAEQEFSTPLDLDRPLWRIIVISHPSLSHAALLYSIHHSLADGLSGMALFYTLCDNSPETAAGANLSALRSFKRTRAWEHSSYLASYRRLIGDALKRVHTHSLKGNNSTQRRFMLKPIPLCEIKKFRSDSNPANGTTLSVNEFFLQVVTNGLRNYFESRKETPTPCAALIPVNLRNKQDITELGNHLTAVRVLLPVNEASASRQSKLITDELQRVQSDGSFDAYAIASGITSLIPSGLRHRLLRYVAKRIDCICTNAPGPKKTRWIAGAKICQTWGIPALMHSQGIGFAAVRYEDTLYISCVSDPGIVKDPDLLMQGIDLYLQSLSEISNSTTRLQASEC